jgi:hypothetical protein
VDIKNFPDPSEFSITPQQHTSTNQERSVNGLNQPFQNTPGNDILSNQTSANSNPNHQHALPFPPPPAAAPNPTDMIHQPVVIFPG